MRILVTGATDGIGRQTALELARRGHDVIVHGRSAARTAPVVAALRALSPSTPQPVHADLADLEQVRALGDLLSSQPLDVVLHNAGIIADATRRTTADGRELTMAVNHDATVLLTHLLLPALRAAPAARVVLVSSMAHARGRISLDDIDMERGYSAYGAYAASKLANVLLAVALARRFTGTPMSANALHPGVVTTKLLQKGFGSAGPDSLEEGAATSVYLAVDPAGAATSGSYFVRQRPARAHALADDAAFVEAFYRDSCRRVGVAPL